MSIWSPPFLTVPCPFTVPSQTSCYRTLMSHSTTYPNKFHYRTWSLSIPVTRTWSLSIPVTSTVLILGKVSNSLSLPYLGFLSIPLHLPYPAGALRPTVSLCPSTVLYLLTIPLSLATVPWCPAYPCIFVPLPYPILGPFLFLPLPYLCEIERGRHFAGTVVLRECVVVVVAAFAHRQQRGPHGLRGADGHVVGAVAEAGKIWKNITQAEPNRGLQRMKMVKNIF